MVAVLAVLLTTRGSLVLLGHSLWGDALWRDEKLRSPASSRVSVLGRRHSSPSRDCGPEDSWTATPGEAVSRKPPAWLAPGCLTLRNCEITKVCCFRRLSFGGNLLCGDR